jgi:HSP20 family molecular chaperone IbpA
MLVRPRWSSFIVACTLQVNSKRENSMTTFNFPHDILSGNFADKFLDFSTSTVKSKFPLYDLTRSGDVYTLRLATAGYSRDQLSIDLEDGMLTVSGKAKHLEEIPTESVIHRSISGAAFQRKFLLDDGVEVRDAAYVDGILTINCEVKRKEHSSTSIKIG